MAKAFSITIDNTETLQMIEGVLARVKNPEPLLKHVGEYIRGQTRKMFYGNRPDTSTVRGVRWPKIAQSTRQKKLSFKKLGKLAWAADRPLVETGRLRQSLEARSALNVHKSGLVFGTDVKRSGGFAYPAAHQTGTSKMPQRRFLFLNDKNLMQICYDTKAYLEAQKRGVMT